MTDARALAFRLRLMVLEKDAKYLSPSGVCTETRQIEDLFGIRLRHALCTHPDFTLPVHLWRETTPN